MIFEVILFLNENFIKNWKILYIVKKIYIHYTKNEFLRKFMEIEIERK